MIGSQRSTGESTVEYVSLTVIVGSGLIPAYHMYVSGILKKELLSVISFFSFVN